MCNLHSVECEISTTRDVSQRKLIRDRGQISQEIQHFAWYCKEDFVSIDKLFNISNSYMLHCALTGGCIVEKGGGSLIEDIQ